jgi:iron complex outermembrane receptor protein
MKKSNERQSAAHVRFFRIASVAPVVAAALAAPGAWAQQVATPGERIEVTGSAIRRIDAETALPVQILRRDDIDRIAASTTEELLQHVTALAGANGVFVAQANGTVTTSASNVSLRGLGATRTLVLVNGRRVAVFGGTASIAVDVNSIPMAAIERIEILKDGASSLYGSDAVAGVINFIMRKDYRGAEVTAFYGEPTKSGGGKDFKIDGFLGYGDLDKDRYNLMFGAGYEKRDAITGASRSYAHNISVDHNNDLSSTIAFPGNILFGPTFSRLSSPAFPNCGPTGIVSPFFIGNATSGTACRFENSPFLDVSPQLTAEHALLNGSFRISGHSDAYFESGWTHNEFEYHTQPVPISEATALPATNPYIAYLNNLINTQYPTLPAGLRRFANLGQTLVLLPPSSPYYPTSFVASLGLPTNQPIGFRYRDFANGQRLTRDSSDNYRIVAGLRGDFSGWDYDSAFLYSESKAKSELLQGYPLYSKYLPILDSGIINPFAPTTDPAAIAAAVGAEFRGAIYSSKTSTTSWDFRGSRDLYQMQAGPLSMALGGEIRQEKFTFDPSQAYQIGDVAGFGGNILGVDKSRHVGSIYTEFAIPIVKTLDMDVGVRYDNYQTVGSTTNPKVSLRWQPTQQLLLRASGGTGFRAPSLTDLYTAQASSVTPNGSRDPLRCPNPATGAPSDCNNQFPTITGGNPNLKPEKSWSSTFGIVYEPAPAISLGLDAFWIELKDSIVIGGLNSQFILLNAANATAYSSFLIRGAPDGNASGLGPIIDVIQTNANLFKVKVSGYDVSFSARPQLPVGKLQLRLDGTYFWQFDRQQADGTYTPQVDQAINAAGGVIPRWHHVASATYDYGPWEGTILQNYQKSYHDIPNNIPPVTQRVVGDYSTWDIQGVYLGLKNWRFALGVKNVFDQNPPYTNEGGQFAAGYDITYADVRGRFVYGTLTWSWK